MYKLGTIYYISKNNIELIYKYNFGPNTETTYKNEYEQRKGLSLKPGLEKFLTVLTGTTFLAEGTIEKSNTKAEKIILRALKLSNVQMHSFFIEIIYRGF